MLQNSQNAFMYYIPFLKCYFFWVVTKKNLHMQIAPTPDSRFLLLPTAVNVVSWALRRWPLEDPRSLNSTERHYWKLLSIFSFFFSMWLFFFEDTILARGRRRRAYSFWPCLYPPSFFFSPLPPSHLSFYHRTRGVFEHFLKSFLRLLVSLIFIYGPTNWFFPLKIWKVTINVHFSTFILIKNKIGRCFVCSFLCLFLTWLTILGRTPLRAWERKPRVLEVGIR